MSLLGALVGDMFAFGVWYSGIVAVALDRPRLYYWLSERRSIRLYAILIAFIAIGYLIM
jgi:hypothetical protein